MQIIYYTDSEATKCKLIDKMIYELEENGIIPRLQVNDLKDLGMFKFVEQKILNVPTLIIKSPRQEYQLIGKDLNIQTIKDTIQKVKNDK